MDTRRFLSLACGVVALAAQTSFAAPKSDTTKSSRFYGKLTSVNERNITVHNAKKNEDGTFQMSEDTRITKNKQDISPKELKMGESLVVYYVSENDIARARRISVRSSKTE